MVTTTPRTQTLTSESHPHARTPHHLLANVRRLNELYSELDQILTSVQDPHQHRR